jgi:hypothetical protein
MGPNLNGSSPRKPKWKLYGRHNQWGCTTGDAAPVATATFYVLKENKAEKICDRWATFTTVYVVGW